MIAIPPKQIIRIQLILIIGQTQQKLSELLLIAVTDAEVDGFAW
jgi:hypothetical protein